MCMSGLNPSASKIFPAQTSIRPMAGCLLQMLDPHFAQTQRLENLPSGEKTLFAQSPAKTINSPSTLHLSSGQREAVCRRLHEPQRAERGERRQRCASSCSSTSQRQLWRGVGVGNGDSVCGVCIAFMARRGGFGRRRRGIKAEAPLP
mmetsp:Transcript_18820/g.47052  ORF Transcript_18820/g.47052 Transcript_18820/m.47052 type:complete len:148 (+) Transcript_18820:908-1351(+)